MLGRVGEKLMMGRDAHDDDSDDDEVTDLNLPALPTAIQIP